MKLRVDDVNKYVTAEWSSVKTNVASQLFWRRNANFFPAARHPAAATASQTYLDNQ